MRQLVDLLEINKGNREILLGKEHSYKHELMDSICRILSIFPLSDVHIEIEIDTFEIIVISCEENDTFEFLNEQINKNFKEIA